MIGPKHRAALVRLRAAIDAILEKGYGDGRGCEADEASTEVAMQFGDLPIQCARADRLRDALSSLIDSGIGPLTVSQGAALANARRELEHDRSVFK